ncbi:hypothetical protein ACFYY8_31170 [Streptosporangium sp. NPDC001559]|uniref:hypothetical protein n=1 Tax=Streptosporangium sp. NPDC001559 TaxID=3366187 RepID=UPI0036EE45CF
MTALAVALVGPTAPDQPPVPMSATSAALLTAATAISALQQARVMGMEAVGIIRQAVAPARVEVVLDPLDAYLRSIGQDPQVLYRWSTPLPKTQVAKWLRDAAGRAVKP